MPRLGVLIRLKEDGFFSFPLLLFHFFPPIAAASLVYVLYYTVGMDNVQGRAKERTYLGTEVFCM